MNDIKYKSIIAIVALLSAPTAFAEDESAESEGETVGKVTWKKGEAERRASGKSDWAGLKKADKVFLNDEVRTGRSGRVEITLNDRSVVRIDRRSTIRLTKFQISAASSTLRGGDLLSKMWLNVKQKSPLKGVETPTAVAGVRGTVFRVDVDADGATAVKVYKGEVNVDNAPAVRAAKPECTKKAPTPPGERVEIEGPEEVSLKAWEALVKDMMEVKVDACGNASTPKKFDPAADKEKAWADWNEKCDADGTCPEVDSSEGD